MRTKALTFTAPRQIEIRESTVSEPAADELLVETEVSAISPGSELLMYRGEFPQEMAADSTIAALAEPLRYPMTYGYACVGCVVACGRDVAEWQGRRIFAFNPHQTHFLVKATAVHLVPDGMAAETAVFLPNVETAVSFVMDGQPAIGEKVLLLGQGIVGLLTTALLAQFPLGTLISADLHPLRREWSKRLGAHHTFDPINDADELKAVLSDDHYGGADVTYELSGNPQALNLAIEMTGVDGRVIIGSWYGQKRAPINLGGHFHRSQMRLISSQVSQVAARWNGRWSKERRFQTAWQQLATLQPERLITHRIPIQNATQGYEQLDQRPGETVQVLLDYAGV